MPRDPLRDEAERRIERACGLINAAYRLCLLDPRETLADVRAAIKEGAEAGAADIGEMVDGV